MSSTAGSDYVEYEMANPLWTHSTEFLAATCNQVIAQSGVNLTVSSADNADRYMMEGDFIITGSTPETSQRLTAPVLLADFGKAFKAAYEREESAIGGDVATDPQHFDEVLWPGIVDQMRRNFERAETGTIPSCLLKFK